MKQHSTEAFMLVVQFTVTHILMQSDCGQQNMGEEFDTSLVYNNLTPSYGSTCSQLLMLVSASFTLTTRAGGE